MLEIKLYESPDVANRTAGLPLALPVLGLATWNCRVGTKLQVLGLRYEITKLFSTVEQDECGAYIYARLQAAGGVGAFTGWLSFTKQLPGERWATYLASPLNGTHHVATSNTHREALAAADIVAQALGITV